MRIMRPSKRRVLQALPGWAAAGLVFFVLGADSALAQCALCRDAVAAAPSATREAMNYAIIGLAFTPYVVAALAAWTLSPAVRAFVRGRLKSFSVRAPGRLP